jgi:hypothetical protein
VGRPIPKVTEPAPEESVVAPEWGESVVLKWATILIPALGTSLLTIRVSVPPSPGVGFDMEAEQVAAGAGGRVALSGADAVVLATGPVGAGATRDLVGEAEGLVAALGGEATGEGGMEVIPAEGVALRVLAGVEAGAVAGVVAEASLADTIFVGGRSAPPPANRTRPAISTPTACFRLPIRSPRMPPFAAAIPPSTSTARPTTTRNAATFFPRFVVCLPTTSADETTYLREKFQAFQAAEKSANRWHRTCHAWCST